MVQVTSIATARGIRGGDSKLCVTDGEKTRRYLGCGMWQLLDFLSFPVPRHSWIQHEGRREQGERQTLGSARSSHFISASGRSGWASLKQAEKPVALCKAYASLEESWARLHCRAPCLPLEQGHRQSWRLTRAEISSSAQKCVNSRN